MRSYGAINEAEFFAVATESFFEKPEQMNEHTPDLYKLLREFYGCDPLAARQRARANRR
jgi:Mlc titration factor MtfA (ptsG expression regulator)